MGISGSHMLCTRVTESQDKILLDGFFLMDNKSIHIQQLPDVIWQKMTAVISKTAEETTDVRKMNRQFLHVLLWHLI